MPRAFDLMNFLLQIHVHYRLCNFMAVKLEYLYFVTLQRLIITGNIAIASSRKLELDPIAAHVQITAALLLQARNNYCKT